MSRFFRWSTRSNTTVVIVSAVIVLAIFLVAVTRGDGDDSPDRLLQVALLSFVGLVLLVGLTRLGILLAGVDPDAELIANRLAPRADERRLLARWLKCTRWARNVGGISGIVWWVLGTSLQGDLLLFGVGGVALGSMAAQLHHVRSRSGRRTASLDRRTLTDYLPPDTRRRMLAVAAAAAALALAGAALEDSGAAVGWGLATLVLLAATVAVQRRVAGRPRPLLTSGLRQADDLARQLAIVQGLAQPATYCGLALVAHGAGRLKPGLGDLATLLSVITWLVALRLWLRNRRLGLDHLLELPPAVVEDARV